MRFIPARAGLANHPAATLSLCLLLALAACSPQQPQTTVVTPSTAPPGAALEFASPEAVGMDSQRLNRVKDAMQAYVDDGLLAGVVTMAARDNKIVHSEAVGFRDLEAQAPMTTDAIFRIYSMSKPVTGVALMILYEEGKFRLSDPVEMYIPQMKDLQVYAGTDAEGNMITEPQNHRMTIRELMSHTGGLTYGIFAHPRWTRCMCRRVYWIAAIPWKSLPTSWARSPSSTSLVPVGNTVSP